MVAIVMCDASGHTCGSVESILRFEDPAQQKVKSYISDELIIKLQHLASYVSHQNAMAYDTCLHK
jgi:hypothetical protein